MTTRLARPLALSLALAAGLGAGAAHAIMARNYLTTFGEHRAEVLACYTAAHPAGSRVAIEFAFGGNGRVSRAQVVSMDQPNMAPVGQCIIHLAGGWQFAMSSSGGSRRYEFDFHTGANGPLMRELR